MRSMFDALVDKIQGQEDTQRIFIQREGRTLRFQDTHVSMFKVTRISSQGELKVFFVLAEDEESACMQVKGIFAQCGYTFFAERLPLIIRGWGGEGFGR